MSHENDAFLEFYTATLGRAVRGGFLDESNFLEEAGKLLMMELGTINEKTISELEARIRPLILDQRVREAGWNEPTMNDAIDRAFEELNASGIVALQKAGYTQSDGWSLVNDAAMKRSPKPRGAVFYHDQDVERAVGGSGLLLAFGAFEENGSEGNTESISIGREVCDGIAGAGDGRDLLAVLEDGVAGHAAAAGNARRIPTQDRRGAAGAAGGQAGGRGRNVVCTVHSSDDRPGLAGPAAVEGGIIALRPPFRLVDDTVFDRGHARGVDVACDP